MDSPPPDQNAIESIRKSFGDDFQSEESSSVKKSVYEYVFPKYMRWFEDYLKFIFKLERRNVTIWSETFAGIVHFVSCLYVLPIVPQQLSTAGYPLTSTAVLTAAVCGVGSILCGLFSNLPFIISPPVAVSIFISVYLKGQTGMTVADSNSAVTLSGILLLLIGYRPLGRLVNLLIPSCIQFSTAVSIGMITALDGCVKINLIVRGVNTLDMIGPITPNILISLSGFLIIGLSMHYHIKGGFLISVIFCSAVYWGYSPQTFPSLITSIPYTTPIPSTLSQGLSSNAFQLLFDLIFLYVICLNGLSRAFSDLAGLTRPDGAVPRGRWVYITCGLLTIISGLLGGPPAMMSAESGAGIKAGAKTGLSAVVCGILFCITTFFTPFFQAFPEVGTSPCLIAIGVLLFTNVKNIDWNVYKYSFPAFVIIFFVPFSFSLFQGVTFGWLFYLVMNILTGDMYYLTFDFLFLLLRDPKATVVESSDPVQRDIERVETVWKILSNLKIKDVFIKLLKEILNFDEDYSMNYFSVQQRDQEELRTRMASVNYFDFGPSFFESPSIMKLDSEHHHSSSLHRPNNSTHRSERSSFFSFRPTDNSTPSIKPPHLRTHSSRNSEISCTDHYNLSSPMINPMENSTFARRESELVVSSSFHENNKRVL